MSDITTEAAAESRVADLMYGPEKTEEPERQVEPVVEGDEAEPEQTEEIELTEEEEQAAEQLEEAAPELFEFQVGETVYEVPPEIRDELEKAKDYTQKTQGVKKEFETAQLLNEQLKVKANEFQFAESVRDEVAQIQMADAQIAQYREYMRANIDKMSGQDLEKIRFQIDELETAKDGITQSVQTKHQEHQQAQEQAVKELLNKSTDVLKAKVPNWGDDTKKALVGFAEAHGFAAAEVENVADPRQWEILWKAAEYDRLKEGTAQAVKKVTGAPKIQAKPRNPMPKRTQDKLNLRKKLKSENRSAAEKATLIGEDVAKRFGM